MSSDVNWEVIQFFAGLFLIALFMVLLHVILLSVAFRKSQQNQLMVLAALEAANRANAETLAELKGIRDALQAGGTNDSALELDNEDKEGGETPADFVYCPECSTRVEVDPFIRNINVICPDCKKPFHIH